MSQITLLSLEEAIFASFVIFYVYIKKQLWWKSIKY